MDRGLKTFVVVVMLALLPVRALATVTVGFCALHDHSAAQTTSGHGATHDHEGAGHGHDGHHDDNRCNACVEHCASASLVASPQLPLPAAAPAQRVVSSAELVWGFVPDRLDRPPLASL